MTSLQRVKTVFGGLMMLLGAGLLVAYPVDGYQFIGFILIVVLLGAGILISLPLGQIFPRLRESLEGGKLKPIGYLAALLLLVLCFTELAAGGFAPFIYAQF